MSKQYPDLSLAAIFALIWRHRKFLSILAAITIVIASIISLFLTEYYRSTVVIFPARTNSLSLNESSVKRGNISDFGEEEEAEQLLQIINSEDLQERVIRKNDLYQHYEIDPNDKYARSKIRQKYRSNITAKRTKYNSIDISAVDIDPQKAADIANSISEFTDSVKNHMIQVRARTSMVMLDQEQERLNEKLNAVTKELDELQMLGVVSEVERSGLYEGYGSAIGNADRKTAEDIRSQLEVNRKYGDEYDEKRKRREILTDQMLRFNNYRNQFLADASIDIPQKFVVDVAVPADKKSYPVRWLIVLGALISVQLFALVLLIIRDNRWSFLRD
ncbi:MAG: hypothetical protein HKN76_09530 [Saprospiraceae bacterium]|nr:hypothetical protein [Saprospiraceae bacterium]